MLIKQSCKDKHSTTGHTGSFDLSYTIVKLFQLIPTYLPKNLSVLAQTSNKSRSSKGWIFLISFNAYFIITFIITTCILGFILNIPPNKEQFYIKAWFYLQLQIFL